MVTSGADSGHWLDIGAQRLSASKEWSLAGRSPADAATRVLNAFRHQRNGHLAIAQALPLQHVCSTPFGIKGMVTTPPTPPTSLLSGAQRLSASKEWSPRPGPHRRSLPNVLNAFRHQRNGHRLPRPRPSLRRSVLNAFRHQRNGHAPRGPAGSLPRWVLNAFRHQRNGHVNTGRTAQESFECSTPFGIKGMVTLTRPRGPAGPLGAQRLSASKEWSPEIPGEQVCLTRGAQRLSASKEWSRWKFGRMPLSKRLCSTPFGIKGMVTLPLQPFVITPHRS